MGGVLEDQPGGIAGLREVVAEHPDVVEYELLKLGRRLDDLGTEALSWRDLYVVVKHARRWDTIEYLLAGILDAVNWANYQRANGKGPKPKPVPRPVEENRNTVRKMTPEERWQANELLGGPFAALNKHMPGGD